MDIVYAQPLKELLAVGTYFNEQLVVLVTTEVQEKKAKEAKLNPCYLVTDSVSDSDLHKFSQKKKAVLGGSIKANELAVKIKADYLLSPSSTKQFFDLGLAKKLGDNGTVVVMMFGELLKANSFERHLFWKNYIEVARYCKIKGTPFLVASGCADPLHLRPSVVREALAVSLGYPRELARKALADSVK